MRKTIRLACATCDRHDCNGISAAELKHAIKNGWKEVSRVQNYRESCKTCTNSDDAPRGYSVFEWWTHLGLCPECAKREGEE